jgi:hypothetical protein
MVENKVKDATASFMPLTTSEKNAIFMEKVYHLKAS